MSASSLLSKMIAVFLQSFAAQLLGIGFFFLLSARLSTADFGLFSWANAVGALCTTVIGAGLEQVVFRRIAVSNTSFAWTATAFLAHSIAGSILVFIALLIFQVSTPGSHSGIAILPMLFAVQALALFILPLKVLLNARSVFMPYAIITFLCNAGRIAVLYGCIFAGLNPDVHLAIRLMLVFTILELFATALYVWLSRFRPPIFFPLRAYRALLQEATPQYMSVLLDVGLARADWILLGILSTDAATGRYSFAYRAFELLKLPIVALSLLLMPRIANMMSRNGLAEPHKFSIIQQIYRLEMWAACGLVLCTNIVWVPLAGTLTHDRYGASNATETMLLTLSLPLQFAINLMWMLAFSAKKYALIARITLIVSLLNLILNIILIPSLYGIGAAIAFLAASVIQAILYLSLLSQCGMNLSFRPLLTCIVIASACYCSYCLFFKSLEANYIFCPIMLIIYAAITFVCSQWNIKDIVSLKKMLVT